MKKLKLQILFYFLFLCTLYAQQDTLKEVFPLSVGNKWIYSFYTGAVSSMSHSSVSDTGNVELEIIGKIDTLNSIRWQFFQRREYYHYVYGYPLSGWKKDSSSFEIIEDKNGLHELYREPFDKNAVFPFEKTSVDSEKIYRYTDIKSPDYSMKTRGINGGYENDYYTFNFNINTGIIKSTRKWSNASSMSNWARYYLSECDSYYNEPFLSLPQTSINIITLAGISKDTVITILNNGTKPLIISEIASSNKMYEIINFSSNIQPQSEGNIIVRFHPKIEGNSETVLTIYSNSIHSFINSISIYGTSKINIHCFLSQNYPNPFNSKTNIVFYNGSNSTVSLKIYDILGRYIATLYEEFLHSGEYEIEFDGSNLSSGVYFYRLQSGVFSETKKFVLLK